MIYVALRDGGHGKETPGKRTPKISSLGRSIKETEFNEPVSYLFGEEMKRHGVIVHDVSSGSRDVSLVSRTNEANRLLNHYINKYGAGNVRIVLVSFHFNAFDGSFDGANPSGISVHIQPGSTHARRLAECVGKYLRQGTKQVYRGIVEQNLHMTREFDGVGILTENGFMDHKDEAMLMLNKNFQKEVARETAQGVLEYFGLKYMLEEVKTQQKPKEEPNVVEKAIVLHSEDDLLAAKLLINKLGCALYLSKSIYRKSGDKVKHMYIIGGNKDGVKADEITLISGADRVKTINELVDNHL